MALTKNKPKLRSRVFLPHAAIQVFVLLLTCVGLALGLLLPVAGRTPHKCVGYLTLALALFPLTAALWRPKVKAGVEGLGSGSGAKALRRRQLWEGCHRASGLAAVAVAFVDGALGVRRTGMRPRCVPAAIMVRLFLEEFFLLFFDGGRGSRVIRERRFKKKTKNSPFRASLKNKNKNKTRREPGSRFLRALMGSSCSKLLCSSGRREDL